ncbi:MAG: hypothetical protein ACO1RT_02395 [Planctomycetaceae bacterium]
MSSLFARRAIVFAAAAVIGTQATCFGQLSDANRKTLSAAIQEARKSLNPQRLPNFENAKTEVLAAVQNVENYFRPITSEANLAKWKLYLATDPLVQSIQADESDEQVWAHAQRTHGRLIGRNAGLELWPLVELRDKIDQLIGSMRYQDSEKSVQFVDQQLQSLDQRITEVGPIPSTEETASLAAITKVIGQSNQAPAVPDAFRSAFSRPNLVFSVSSSFVQQAASQVICRSRAINDCILGTRVVGNGTLQGTVTAQTIPSYGQATVQLTLAGRFHSRSIGYNGPVSLNTVGSGDVMSTRTLYLSESGVSLAPTVTSANLATQITSINHPLRLVRKIASKKAAQQKPKADAIAAAKFRRQVGDEFSQQINEAVASGMSGRREDELAKMRTSLVRLNVPEPSRTIGSTQHAIFLEATQAAHDQLAAINAPPPLPIGIYDVAIQLHESAVDNVASRVLAGRTMTGEQLDQLMADAGKPPRPASSKPAEESGEAGEEDEALEPFVIDFARFRPLIFEARDQTLKVGLRGTRFSQGDRELRRPLEITAIYKPVQAADGSLYLERVGDVGVDFPGGRRLTISQVALRRSIQRAFDDRFPPTLLHQTLTLPTTLTVESLRGQNMRTSAIDARDGWLSVSAR